MSDSEEQKELAARVKDLAWLRAKREKDDLWQLRRSKILEALLIWGAVGVASLIVAGATGLARFVVNNWDLSLIHI